MPFSALGLSPALTQAATAMGFVAPTPIQEAAIPAILRGADVVGSAQTGSGKTAAFALPLLQQLQLSATGGPCCNSCKPVRPTHRGGCAR